MRASGVMPRRPPSSTHHAARPRARASWPIALRPARNSDLLQTSDQAGSIAGDGDGDQPGSRRCPGPGIQQMMDAPSIRRHPVADTDRRRRHGTALDGQDGQRLGVRARQDRILDPDLPATRWRRTGARDVAAGFEEQPGAGGQARKARRRRPPECEPLADATAVHGSGGRTDERRARRAVRGEADDPAIVRGEGVGDGETEVRAMFPESLEVSENGGVEPATGEASGPVDGREHRAEPPRDRDDAPRSGEPVQRRQLAVVPESATAPGRPRRTPPGPAPRRGRGRPRGRVQWPHRWRGAGPGAPARSPAHAPRTRRPSRDRRVRETDQARGRRP